MIKLLATKLNAAAVVLSMLAAVPLTTLAQDYPNRPIRLIVPLPQVATRT